MSFLRFFDQLLQFLDPLARQSAYDHVLHRLHYFTLLTTLPPTSDTNIGLRCCDLLTYIRNKALVYSLWGLCCFQELRVLGGTVLWGCKKKKGIGFVTQQNMMSHSCSMNLCNKKGLRIPSERTSLGVGPVLQTAWWLDWQTPCWHGEIHESFWKISLHFKSRIYWAACIKIINKKAETLNSGQEYGDGTPHLDEVHIIWGFQLLTSISNNPY